MERGGSFCNAILQVYQLKTGAITLTRDIQNGLLTGTVYVWLQDLPPPSL